MWLVRIIREVRKAGNSCWFAVRWFAVSWFALPFSSPLSPEAVWQMGVQIRHCYVQFCILWFRVSPGVSISEHIALRWGRAAVPHPQKMTVASFSFLYNLPWLILWLQGSSDPLRMNLGSAVLFLMCIVGSSRAMKGSSPLTGEHASPHETLDSMSNL